MNTSITSDCGSSAYGTERSYNGLRLAHALAKRDGEPVRIFLLADAVGCALAGQTTPDGIREDQLVGGRRRSSLEELTDWIVWADKVIAL